MTPAFGGHASKVLLGGFVLNHVLVVLFAKKKKQKRKQKAQPQQLWKLELERTLEVV